MGQTAASQNIVHAHYKSFTAGRWNDYDRQLDPAIFANLPSFPSPIDGVKRYAMRFHAVFDQPHCHLEDFDAQGDTVVATARLWGKLTSPVLGDSRIGEVFIFSCRSLFTVRHHRIVACHTLADKPKELAALGLAFGA